MAIEPINLKRGEVEEFFELVRRAQFPMLEFLYPFDFIRIIIRRGKNKKIDIRK